MLRRLPERKAETEDQYDKSLKAEETEAKAAACQPKTSKPPAEHQVPALTCRQHNRAECPQCNSR